MNTPSRVNTQGTRRRVSVGARYPLERKKMLELIQVQRGDQHLSDTITLALDEFIEHHLRQRPTVLDRTRREPATASQT